MKLIKQGAEARIYVQQYLGKPTIIKERFVKKYRHPSLDEYLTKERIKAECRAILKSRSVGVKTPTIYLADLRRRSIYMEYFENSVTVKDFIIGGHDDSLEALAESIGTQIAKMHSCNIVHGDLTTSNMLLVNNNGSGDFATNCFAALELVFIDFGLAQQEASPEDKGVDLYVLERALISAHEGAEVIFRNILEAYQKCSANEDVLRKYKEVKARGRKRTMIG